MGFIKANIVWIAPTLAIGVSTVALISSGLLDRGQQAAPMTVSAPIAQIAQQPAPVTAPVAAVVAQATPQQIAVDPAESANRWDKLNTLVQASTESQQPAPVQAMAEPEPEKEEVVTRAEPIDLLDTSGSSTSEDAPQARVSFAVNQEALTANTFCGEDLKALARAAQIYFPAGSLTPGGPGLIKARLIGQILRECPGYAVNVEGHSDPSGNSQINLELSAKRAEAVIARLSAAGINTSRFVAVGMGDQRPSNVTGPKGSAYYDRRVEFSVVELAGDQEAAINDGFNFVWNAPAPSECVERLAAKVAETHLIYAPRAVTVGADALAPVADLLRETKACPGTRLRMIGHHSGQAGLREDFKTGRMRVQALMGTMVAQGFSTQQMLIGAPSYSVEVAGNPDMPQSRVEFQIITE